MTGFYLSVITYNAIVAPPFLVSPYRMNESAPTNEEERFSDQSLLHLMAQAYHLLAGEFEEILSRRGVSAQIWHVLAVLYGTSGETVTGLAGLCLMQQPTMTKLLTRMASDQLVRRAPDRRDRRVVRIFLTARGESLAAELIEAARRHEAEIRHRHPELPLAQAKQLFQASSPGLDGRCVGHKRSAPLAGPAGSSILQNVQFLPRLMPVPLTPARVALILGIAQTLAWGTVYYLPAVLVPAVAAELDQPPTLVFAAFSLAMLISGLAAPRTGRMIERLGGRPVLVASALINAAGLALLGLVPGLAGWFLGWILLGLGMALGLYEAAFATLGMLFGRAARRPITIVTLIAGFASTVGWPLTGALIPAFGWQGTMLAYAALHLAVVLPLYLLLPRAGAVMPAPVNAPTTAEPPVREPAPPSTGWARRAFLLLAAFFTLRAVVTGVMSVHFIALFGGLGLSVAAAIAIGALQGPSQVAGRLLEFGLGERAHPLLVARAGAALLPIAVAMLLLFGGAFAPGFMLLYGASNGILTISRGAVPLALFGPRGYPVLMGRLALPILVTQAMVPTLSSPLVERLPAPVMFGLIGLLGAAALGCVLVARAGERSAAA